MLSLHWLTGSNIERDEMKKVKEFIMEMLCWVALFLMVTWELIVVTLILWASWYFTKG